MRVKSTHYYSRNTEKVPIVVERFIRTVRKIIKKPVFEKGYAGWLTELSSTTKIDNDTIHHSIKVTTLQASLKKNGKVVFNNLQDMRKNYKPQFPLGQLVRTGDTEKAFGKGASTNWSNKNYTITEVIHGRNSYLPERYNENLLWSTEISLEENNHVMIEVNLIQWNRI